LLCNYILTLPNHGPFVAILVWLESSWQGDVHNGCFANFEPMEQKLFNLEIFLIFKIMKTIKLIFFQPINASSSYWHFYLPFHIPNLNTFSHFKFKHMGPMTVEFTFEPIRICHNSIFFEKSIVLKYWFFFRKLYHLELWRWSHLGQQHKGALVIGYNRPNNFLKFEWNFTNSRIIIWGISSLPYKDIGIQNKESNGLPLQSCKSLANLNFDSRFSYLGYIVKWMYNNEIYATYLWRFFLKCKIIHVV
jgi:hypothetical protein